MRKSSSREEEEEEMEVDDTNVDQRTIFITQLSSRVTEKDLVRFFRRAGKVKNVRLIADKNSRRTKGFGYIEFCTLEGVEKSMSFTNEKLLGVPMIVQRVEGARIRMTAQAEDLTRLISRPVETKNRIFVGNIHTNLTDNDIRLVFEPFGPLDFATIQIDPESGRSRGFAFVQFRNEKDARHAIEKMNRFELAGKDLTVSLASEKNSRTNYKLDDNIDSPGFRLTSKTRSDLMNRLSRDRNDISENTSITKRESPHKIYSRNVMLKHMFDPKELKNKDDEIDLEDDILAECKKFGKIKHFELDLDSRGEVYMKFQSESDARRCTRALDGRWFGGKQISANMIPDMVYNTKYPKTKSL